MKQLVRRTWERFTSKKVWARSVLADAESVRQNGTDGRWQHETPCKAELELVRHSNHLRFKGVLMPNILCGEVGRLGKLFGTNHGKWQVQRMCKCEGSDFLRRIIVPVKGQGEVTLSHVQNLSYAKLHGPPRSKSVSSSRCTARSLRQLYQCAQSLDKPEERWRHRPSQDGRTRLARKKSAQNKGRTKKVHCGRQPRSGESW